MSRQSKFRNIFFTATLLVATTFVANAQSNEWSVPQNHEDNVGLSTPEPQEENGPTFTPVDSNQAPPTPYADPPPPGLAIDNYIPGLLLIAGIFGVYMVKSTQKVV